MQSHRVPRIARRAGVVCLALVAVLLVAIAFTSRAAASEVPHHARGVDPRLTRSSGSSAASRAKYPPRPLVLREDEHAILAFPPRAPLASGGKPITVVYLHGIRGRAENGCPWLRDGASEVGWLVCPDANEHLPNGTFSWAGSLADRHAVVARAERAAQAQGADPASAGLLVGFSQGAYVALDLVRARLGRHRGLVLIGANVEPSRVELVAAGVDRIVLAAGELDGAASSMKRAAERLRREGMDVRFVPLGRIGHSYETTEKEALRDAIAWAGGAT